MVDICRAGRSHIATKAHNVVLKDDRARIFELYGFDSEIVIEK